jgi:hypothetical protein
MLEKIGGTTDKMITKYMTSSFKKAGKVIKFALTRFDSCFILKVE